jgi:hypothetical protein
VVGPALVVARPEGRLEERRSVGAGQAGGRRSGEGEVDRRSLRSLLRTISEVRISSKPIDGKEVRKNPANPVSPVASWWDEQCFRPLDVYPTRNLFFSLHALSDRFSWVHGFRDSDEHLYNMITIHHPPAPSVHLHSVGCIQFNRWGFQTRQYGTSSTVYRHVSHGLSVIRTQLCPTPHTGAG